jgi:hypothetical protein
MVESSGRIDIGADEFDFGQSSIMPQVSFADAEAVNELMALILGSHPSSSPSILQVLALCGPSSAWDLGNDRNV